MKPLPFNVWREGWITYVALGGKESSTQLNSVQRAEELSLFEQQKVNGCKNADRRRLKKEIRSPHISARETKLEGKISQTTFLQAGALAADWLNSNAKAHPIVYTFPKLFVS